jgi:hypothetical protein
MAKHDTYTVHYKGQKTVDFFKSEPILGEKYDVLKYDERGIETGVYTVTVNPIAGEFCECKASHAKTCRHREMVRIFKEAFQIDKDDLRYNFDRKEWIPANST